MLAIFEKDHLTWRAAIFAGVLWGDGGDRQQGTHWPRCKGGHCHLPQFLSQSLSQMISLGILVTKSIIYLTCHSHWHRLKCHSWSFDHHDTCKEMWLMLMSTENNSGSPLTKTQTKVPWWCPSPNIPWIRYETSQHWILQTAKLTSPTTKLTNCISEPDVTIFSSLPMISANASWKQTSVFSPVFIGSM